ncbi:MAG: DUF1016 N-terminal domain-containing protein [Melioribacteraceae bacterium]|nr:DUF1016 N-terminal domain-containing protein [Melioribacteraceae bacterium]
MKKESNITHPQKTESKYGGLISSIETLLKDSRTRIVREVNQTIVITYWHIGRYIVEYEQGGKERAEYGTELLKRLSKDLTTSFGKGYSWRNLYNMTQFYTLFPILQSVIAKSEGQNVPSLMAQSEKQKGQSVIAKSQNLILQSLSAKSPSSTLQSAFIKLTWTHFVRLLSVKNEDERSFYLIETAENNWSVRELNRQINSSLFERLLLSKDKKGVKELSLFIQYFFIIYYTESNQKRMLVQLHKYPAHKSIFRQI